jgi:rSAM/selenodomain-associated transferase 2
VSRLTIIMPVLDEGDGIEAALAALAPQRSRGTEVIIVDGGSTDETLARAKTGADLVIDAPRGRASQMNAGAALATGEVLLFLHADTRLPADADILVLDRLKFGEAGWGRFDVMLEGSHWMLPVIAFMMNLRSRLTGIATGDQAIFASTALFQRVGGYPDIALMEDIALSKALGRISPPIALRQRVEVRARRFEAKGVWRLILLMWRLRLAYWMGADPAALALRYGYVPRAD